MMTFNEVLMALYILITGIFLTYTLTKLDENYNWYFCIKERKNRFLAYFGFIIFFFVNLFFLYIAYDMLIRRGPFFNYFNNILCINILSGIKILYHNKGVIFNDLRRISIFFIPMIIAAVLNESIPKMYPKKKEPEMKGKNERKKDKNDSLLFLAAFIIFFLIILISSLEFVISIP